MIVSRYLLPNDIVSNVSWRMSRNEKLRDNFIWKKKDTQFIFS